MSDYANRATWDTPAPSMDEKDIPSPPIRTTAEYERDCDLGIVTPVGRKPSVPVYGQRKGNVADANGGG